MYHGAEHVVAYGDGNELSTDKDIGDDKSNVVRVGKVADIHMYAYAEDLYDENNVGVWVDLESNKEVVNEECRGVYVIGSDMPSAYVSSHMAEVLSCYAERYILQHDERKCLVMPRMSETRSVARILLNKRAKCWKSTARICRMIIPKLLACCTYAQYSITVPEDDNCWLEANRDKDRKRKGSFSAISTSMLFESGMLDGTDREIYLAATKVNVCYDGIHIYVPRDPIYTGILDVPDETGCVSRLANEVE